jgi:4-aminobutyrate aminotransferase/(S)-3-amino-2-methylpropionate transaminase
MGVEPDIVCLGKGLGSGLPVSACIGSDRAMAAWGEHGGATIHTATHFGSPLACAAAVATLEVIEEARLPIRARAAGERWIALLRHRTMGCGVRDVRGRGLMVGVVLEGGAGRALAVTRGLLQRGWIVLTGGVAGDVLTLTPPLDIQERLLDAFADALAETLRPT